MIRFLYGPVEGHSSHLPEALPEIGDVRGGEEQVKTTMKVTGGG